MTLYKVSWSVVVEAESPESALDEAQTIAETDGLLSESENLRVRMAPFDRPSTMWNVAEDENGDAVFRRMR
jgi:hypothetical protein